jgi:diguanylate cyclase (GGDEF)-like protein
MISSSRNLVEVVTQWGPPVWGERVFVPEDCWALRRSRLNWFNARENSMRCHHADAPQVTESVCIPLTAQGEALGILHLQPRRAGTEKSVPTGFRENERKLAVLLAEQIGMALGNLKLRERLRNQSIRDPLTGLFNRRYLEESLEREMSRATRDKASVAIIMLDIDHFKEFNDTYGHQAGDAALRTMADFLKKTIRGQDIVCRYGGEEFALVFGGSSVEGAHERAEALRERIKNLEIHHGGQLLRSITASMGVALFPDHGLSVSDVLRSADQALYCAKREGRDQICVWSAGSPA